MPSLLINMYSAHIDFHSHMYLLSYRFLRCYDLPWDAEQHLLLQIDTDHLRVEDDDRRLPDSKSVDWDMPFAMAIIRDAIHLWNIDTVSPHFSQYITSQRSTDLMRVVYVQGSVILMPPA